MYFSTNGCISKYQVVVSTDAAVAVQFSGTAVLVIVVYLVIVIIVLIELAVVL